MSKKPLKPILITTGTLLLGAGVAGGVFYFINQNNAKETARIQTSEPQPQVVAEEDIPTEQIAGKEGNVMWFIRENAKDNRRITDNDYTWLTPKDEYSSLNLAIVGVDENSNLKFYSPFIVNKKLAGFTEFTLGRVTGGGNIESIAETYQKLTENVDVTYSSTVDKMLVDTLRDGWAVTDCQITKDPLLINLYNSTVNTSGDSKATYIGNFIENGDYYTAQSFKINNGQLFQFDISVDKAKVEEIKGGIVTLGNASISLETNNQAAAYIANVASQGGPEAAHKVDDEGNPWYTYYTGIQEIETASIENILDNVAGATFVNE